MRKYEAMIVVDTSFSGDKKENILSNIETIWKKSDADCQFFMELGKKRLAYEINKKRDGYFLLYRFEVDPVNISKIKRFLKLNNFILTSLILQEGHFSEDLSWMKPVREKREEKKGIENGGDSE
ncbi:30S ribosomal protein S6 [PVC group bacterium (ex Bugula neritina AB1)]|nr:30S ribosomal protein S6 [PVC group bacterium (ex Bugula neritina AB1)]